MQIVHYANIIIFLQNQYEHFYQATRLGLQQLHQLKPVAKTEMYQFKDVRSAINRRINFIYTQLSCPLTIKYMEDYMDGAVVKSCKAH